MEIHKAQKQLVILWFGMSLLIGTILVFETASYGSEAPSAWQWLIPNLLPTLTLMLGALVAEVSNSPHLRNGQIDSFLYRLTFALSTVYLLALLGILLAPWSATARLSFMKGSQSLWLNAVQGLVTASLGVFFVKAKQAHQD